MALVYFLQFIYLDIDSPAPYASYHPSFLQNNYSLSFISDIVENIGTKKVFTTLEGLFKPTVMFFRLTNSLATFQMINKIL